MGKKVLNSILVKPAGPDCPMACEYCFYCGKGEFFPGNRIHRMSEDVLEIMIRQAMEQSAGEMSIGWQGGEPTLMGLGFYRKAVELEERFGRGKVVGNGLQTSGILLDREWAGFLKRYNFLVGLSIDGPRHVHDRYRHLGDGGSWERVRDAAAMLLDSGVSVNALSVVSDYSAQFPDEIYDFLKETGLLYMQFIPCVETDIVRGDRAAAFSVSAEAYGNFICRIFDRWIGDFKDGTPVTSVRFFESLLFNYAGFNTPDCTLCETCGDYLVVEHNGDVYSCDFFVEHSGFLGNVEQGNLSDMLNSSIQDAFGRRKADLPGQCADCTWLPRCRGGCPKDRMRDPRDGGLSHFCGAYKMFFQHADGELKRLTDEWRRKAEGERRRRSLAAAGTGEVGRNDPCPCGSGLKYKKCCGGR